MQKTQQKPDYSNNNNVNNEYEHSKEPKKNFDLETDESFIIQTTLFKEQQNFQINNDKVSSEEIEQEEISNSAHIKNNKTLLHSIIIDNDENAIKQSINKNNLNQSLPNITRKLHKNKYNRLSLGDREKNSFIERKESEIIDSTPRFTRIVIKIKDMYIQTDEDPIILPEHLNNNEETLNINEIIHEKKNKIFNKRQLEKIETIQKFYKNRFQQKLWLEQRLFRLKMNNVKKIQRVAKCFLLRLHFKILFQHINHDKILLKRKVVRLKTPTDSFFDTKSYFLHVFLIKSLQTLNFILYDFLTKKIIDTFAEVSSIIDSDDNIESSGNLKKILEYCNIKTDLLEINEGFLDFKELDKNINESLQSDDNNEMVVIKGNNNILPEAISFEALELVQRRIKLMQDRKKLLEKKRKCYKLVFTTHKKLTFNSYLRLCLCYSIQQMKEKYFYIAGAIITDSTYKLNIVILEECLMQAYNHEITSKNIFDIVKFNK